MQQQRKSRQQTVRLPADMVDALERLRRPHRETWTRSEHIRTALVEYLERYADEGASNHTEAT